jgi:hypothetical protein
MAVLRQLIVPNGAVLPIGFASEAYSSRAGPNIEEIVSSSC